MYTSSYPGLTASNFLPARGGVMPFPLGAPRQYRYYRARNALYQLFRDRPGRVLVPDYHHGNEVKAIRAAGAEIAFYRIDRGLLPDLDQLRTLLAGGASAVLAIHYLGFAQPIRELVALAREHGAWLVEDCALALFADTADGAPLGSFGEASVFCLYKTLPVPNGAILVDNHADLTLAEAERDCGAFSLGGRVAELLVDGLRASHPAAGRAAAAAKAVTGRLLTGLGVPRYPTGESGFDVAAVDLRMSLLSSYLASQIDHVAIRSRRRANFLRLRDQLAGRVRLLGEALPDGACPLFFPILVPDKAAAARALVARGVAAVEFWNDGDPAAQRAGSDAEFLRRHLLELPIHQGLDAEHVDFVARQVLATAGEHGTW